MTFLVTGCAGFLGSHLSEHLTDVGEEVVGVDSFTDYYLRELKESNLEGLRGRARFTLFELDLGSDPLEGALDGVDTVFHLAAQPGVRGSFGASFGRYVHDNVLATQRLLEASATARVETFIYASSSSVYGNSLAYPTPEDTRRAPISPYGLTKLATEELAAVYCRLEHLHTVGLRYFTVYGPRQRPDMAFAKFFASALAGKPVKILGDGSQVRDFTFVDDAVRGTIAAARNGRQWGRLQHRRGHPGGAARGTRSDRAGARPESRDRAPAGRARRRAQNLLGSKYCDGRPGLRPPGSSRGGSDAPGGVDPGPDLGPA